MNNVWGRGGLFEQALASKIAGQDADAALTNSRVGVDMMNAQTSRTGVDNDYDIGLRRNAVERGMLDVSRANSDTERFGAETQRLVAGGGVPVAQSEAGNLGLRTFSPITDKQFGDFVAQRNASMPALGMKPTATSTVAPASRTSRPTIFQNGNSFSDREPLQMKRGGLVMKPKMVKQPGYMHGGKITMPKGYKKGGKIGDVKKDTGKDTVDVKAREGEYFLNPETVAAGFGGGNYEAGVRNLNQIVRETTGKEPGPTPVGKSGKAGFQASGSVDPNEEFFRRAAMDKMAQAKRDASAFREAGGPAQTMYVDSKGNASTAAPKNPYASMAEADAGAAIRGGATRAVNAVKSALPSIATVGKGLRVAGKVATPVAAAMDTADVVDVATDPNMTGRDVVGEAAGKAGKWALAGAGALTGASLGVGTGPLAPIAVPVGAAIGGAAGYFSADAAIRGGRALRGLDTRDPSEYSQGVVSDMLGRQNQPTAAVAAPVKEEPKAEAAPRDFDKEVADKLAESKAQEPGLRDMMLSRLQAIDGYQGPFASMVQRGAAAEREQLMNKLTELDKADTIAAVNMANLRATTGSKLREDADKRISERFQIPVYDKDGKIKGFEKDPNAANALRDFAAQTYGMDFYRLTPQQQDIVMQAYDVNSRGTRRFNERLANEGGSSARVTNLPRIGPNSLRSAGEMTWNDIGEPNISLNDWLTSWGPNQMEKMVLTDPVTGQRVAARHVLMNENGTIDDDLIAQMNSALAANQKK